MRIQDDEAVWTAAGLGMQGFVQQVGRRPHALFRLVACPRRRQVVNLRAVPVQAEVHRLVAGLVGQYPCTGLVQGVQCDLVGHGRSAGNEQGAVGSENTRRQLFGFVDDLFAEKERVEMVAGDSQVGIGVMAEQAVIGSAQRRLPDRPAAG